MPQLKKILCIVLSLIPFCICSAQQSLSGDTILNSITSNKDSIALVDKSVIKETDTSPEAVDKINISSTTNENSFRSVYPRLIVPTLFVTYGIIARNNRMVRELDQSTNDEVSEHYKKQIPYDNYIQFLPAVSVYGLNLMGVKGERSLRDVTIVMVTSHLLMAATVQTMKSATKIRRPDGSTNNSFPSGHTATAFVGAHILFREYYKKSVWIASSGYVFSTATGVMRVLNKRHWISDVVTGAGIGILSVEASYLLLPVINKLLFPGTKDKQLSLAPSINPQNMGLNMVYIF